MSYHARVMAVLEPVKVVITNLDAVMAADLEVPDIPHLPDKGFHTVTFNPSDLYMERSDIREVLICFH